MVSVVCMENLHESCVQVDDSSFKHYADAIC